MWTVREENGEIQHGKTVKAHTKDTSRGILRAIRADSARVAG